MHPLVVWGTVRLFTERESRISMAHKMYVVWIC